MTDTATQPTTESPLATIERAKEVADRYKRQVSYLVTLQSRLPILESMLDHDIKVHREASENIDRLTREIKVVKEHIEKLSGWVARNSTAPADIEMANALAAKIKRLQAEIAKKKVEMQRLANGLPDLDD